MSIGNSDSSYIDKMSKKLNQLLFEKSTINDYLEELIATFNNESELILFGAGLGGMKTYNFIENKIVGGKKKVKYFLDNNSTKWNTEFMSSIVYAPAKLIEDYNNQLIIISCGEGDVIKKQLIEMGIKEERIIIPDIGVVELSEHESEYIWKNVNELSAVYEMLEDDKSKKVFENILNYRVSHDISLIKPIADAPESQYFDIDIISSLSNEVFLDCGSYIGDTLEEFVKISKGKYKKVICCEADKTNFEILNDFINNNKIRDVLSINKGVWNEQGIMYFNNIGSGSGTIDASGEIEIVVDKIDTILKEEKVTFIKMDIEGSEYEALIGAIKTISKYTPKLAISVYHKKEDFIRIPLLIKSINPNYKLFFRHYRELSVQETICYAIPE